MRLPCLFLLLLTLVRAFAASPAEPTVPVGVARVDISPIRPVRLMGYLSRADLPPPTNVVQRLHARALAIGQGTQTVVMVTIDNCILPGALTAELHGRIGRRTGLTPAQLAFTVTHTHCAPCLTGAAPNIFARDLTPDDQTAIDDYTRFFLDQVETAVIAALADRRPALLAWGQGSVGFARNRRTAGGPVDHDLPLLRIREPDGTLRAAFVNYACHCTTLSFNASHGDWAGVAALDLETSHPGSVALVAIGCGADANPEPRGTVELAGQHGRALATEARRLLELQLTPIHSAPIARLRSIDIPFQPHFTREQWQQRSSADGIVGHHARRWIARLDRGEVPPPTLPYPIQVFAFDDRLAMVFLGGEVVVDYALRLKSELDRSRLWINAYANDVPGYIPSRRILKEGGYEAETSLWYYDRPQQFDPAIEDLIVATVRELVGTPFQKRPSP
jgi:hypothetical protein